MLKIFPPFALVPGSFLDGDMTGIFESLDAGFAFALAVAGLDNEEVVPLAFTAFIFASELAVGAVSREVRGIVVLLVALATVGALEGFLVRGANAGTSAFGFMFDPGFSGIGGGTSEVGETAVAFEG